jgi:hypothetical protein
LSDLLVDLNCSLDDEIAVRQELVVSAEAEHHDGVENLCDDSIGGEVDVEDEQLGEEAHRDRRATSCLTREDLHVVELALGLIGAIIDETVVNPHSEEFERRLSAELLLGGKVEVFNVADHSATTRRRVDLVGLAIHTTFNNVLNILGGGLSREVDLTSDVSLIRKRLDNSRSDQGFGDTSFADQDGVLARANKLLDNVAMTNRVDGGNNQTVVGSIIRSREGLLEIRMVIPRAPRVGAEVDVVFVGSVVGRNRILDIAENSIKFSARIFCQGTTDRPDHGEHSEFTDLIDVRFASMLRLELAALRKEWISIRRSDGIEELAEGANGGEVSCREQLDTLLGAEFEDLGQVGVDEFLQFLDGRFRLGSVDGSLIVEAVLQPAVDVRLPTEIFSVEVDHTTTRNSSRRRLSEIFDFEQHGDLGSQADTFTRVEGEHLVVIEDSIHGFDPQCVDRTIEQNPFECEGFITADSAHDIRENTILPLTSGEIVATVELFHADGLGVDQVNLGRIVLTNVLVFEALERASEDGVGGGFA